MGRLAIALIVTGCYGGLALGPDRGDPSGGADETGKGIEAFAGGEIELPRGGRIGFGVAVGQTNIDEDPEGHTPNSTWALFELRYVHRILPDIPCGPLLGIGAVFGDSTDGSVRGARATVGCETRTVPIVLGAGLVPQILQFDPDSEDPEDRSNSMRSLHLALWIARSPRSLREATTTGTTDRPAR